MKLSLKFKAFLMIIIVALLIGIAGIFVYDKGLVYEAI